MATPCQPSLAVDKELTRSWRSQTCPLSTTCQPSLAVDKQLTDALTLLSGGCFTGTSAMHRNLQSEATQRHAHDHTNSRRQRPVPHGTSPLAPRMVRAPSHHPHSYSRASMSAIIAQATRGLHLAASRLHLAASRLPQSSNRFSLVLSKAFQACLAFLTHAFLHCAYASTDNICPMTSLRGTSNPFDTLWSFPCSSW